MKTNHKLSELPMEKLLARKKTMLGGEITLGLVMLIACSILLYHSFQEKNMKILTVASTVSVISYLPTMINLGLVNREIKLRNSK